MAKPYTITITNGVGTGNIVTGTYSVTSNTTGYDNTTVDPSQITYDGTTNSYNLKVAATGTLTLKVTDDGTDTGNPIVGAKFKRTDSLGNEYGSEITTNESGIAVFNNVPYAQTGAPNVYYKQTASDGEHSFSQEVVTTSLTESTKTENITNAGPSEVTINYTDANYEGLAIENGEIILN